jgi:hypothetical protein
LSSLGRVPVCTLEDSSKVGEVAVPNHPVR